MPPRLIALGYDSVSNDQEDSDMVIFCRDCLSEFAFTAGEQDFYATRMPPLTQPCRCRECRRARRSDRNMQDGPTGYRD
jgi:hypothetical protein